MDDRSSANLLPGKNILIVDDHKNIRITLRMTLEGEGSTVTEAASKELALAILGALGNPDVFPFDVILLDIRLPDGCGLDVLGVLSEAQLASRVIMISGEGTASEAFKATQLGAFDYVEKPFTPERILVSVSRCLDFNRIRSDNHKLKIQLASNREILGQSPPIKELMATIRKVAPTNGRVLIVGESGTGKELVAREIHRLSTRKDQNLIKVNCAAIPASLIESELFGHEKGAFTGAVKMRKGVFERADGATLFLDEIGELDAAVQAKLLRVLQSGEMSRVGGDKTMTVDVRLIAATNRNLDEMVQAGDFREDLFYRLAVVTLHVPPLRERHDDIAFLAKLFLSEACREHSLGDRLFPDKALDALAAYHWPGNVRELRNFIERVAILSDDSLINDLEGLHESARKEGSDDEDNVKNDGKFHYGCEVLPWHDFHQAAGKSYIKYVLRQAQGNVSEAARLLCLERAYLHRLMRKLGVQRDVIVP